MASGKQYQLSYASKTVRLRRSGLANGPDRKPEYLVRARQAALGEQVVNGIPCRVFKPINGSNGITIGTGCRSLDYDLHLKSEVEFPREGYKLRMVREMYEIQIGLEPAPAVVRIPADFTLVE